MQDWGGVSDEAKDLLRGLLQTDVKQRLSAKEVLKHPWVKQRPPETPLKTPEVLNMLVYYMQPYSSETPENIEHN